MKTTSSKNIRYEFFVKIKNKKNFVVILAIGKKHYKEWKNYSSRLLMQYCKRNKLGLLVIKDFLIEGNDYYAKKPHLHKFLIGSFIKKNFNFIKNICLLDTDILVNPFAPNIFSYHNENKIGVVSMFKNLPYNLKNEVIRKKIAYQRKLFYNKNFPLNSSLNYHNSKPYFKFHKWKDQGNYFCSGLLMFNVNKFYNFFEKIFFNYRNKNFISMTGGDEPIFNYEILKNKFANWLDYKFQVLWTYEMSCKYPFLYEYKLKNPLIQKCVENSISENYFIHFAGTWPEGLMWKNKNLFKAERQKQFQNFNLYKNKEINLKFQTKRIKFK